MSSPSAQQPVRVAVVGDPYMPSNHFVDALAPLGSRCTLRIHDLTAKSDRTPVPGIREYIGEPHEVLMTAIGADVLVVHGAPVSEDILSQLPSLKLIMCARGGPVNVDVAAASLRGISVVNTPGKNAQSVAELAIAMIIAVERNLRSAATAVIRTGRLSESAFDGAEFFGRELQGATLGLVGFGRVARRVAVLAAGFGMRVVTFDPFLPPAEEVSDVERVEDLLTLLRRSDVVSLHARATEENRHLIGAEQLRAMRQGAVIVNTARESLIDEAALLDALNRGWIAGAALDVLNAPDEGRRHELIQNPRVLVLPHVGGATQETLRRGADMLADELTRFLDGVPLKNVVNRNDLGAAAR